MSEVRIVTDNKSEEEIMAELGAARLAHPLQSSDFTSAEIDQLRNVAPMEVEMMEELKRAQEFLSQHPVLKYSPADLKHKGLNLDKYLEKFDSSTQELYREYYGLE